MSGRLMLRLQMGVWGSSPRTTLGSFMNATRAAGSWSRSRILTRHGSRFSRKASFKADVELVARFCYWYEIASHFYILRSSFKHLQCRSNDKNFYMCTFSFLFTNLQSKKFFTLFRISCYVDCSRQSNAL